MLHALILLFILIIRLIMFVLGKAEFAKLLLHRV